jgi:hypothetical protein
MDAAKKGLRHIFTSFSSYSGPVFMDCGYGSAAVRGKSYALIILPFIRHVKEFFAVLMIFLRI